MGSSKEEKLEAFRLFDFEKSEEFKAYLRNVEAPPGDKGMLKVKAKWYKRVKDPDFEMEWLPGLSSSQAAPTSTSTPAAAPPQQQQQQQQQQAPPAGSRSAGGTAANRSPQWLAGRQLNLAVLQALILLFSVIYLQPLRPSLSYWAYSKLMIMLLASQALKIHTAQGLPHSWTLEGIKQWLMRILPTSDAQYFLLALAAAGNKPVMALLPPFVVLSAYSLAHFLSEAFANHPLWRQHGAPLYAKMRAKQQAALAFNAQSEIMLGFLLLVGLLLPGRAPMLCFLSWQFLRMRFWSLDAALYHRQAWTALDQMTAGFRQQLPILQKAVGFGISFFHQGRQP